MSTTPNMGLLLPDPQVTLGPAWASDLNTALGLVDSHNHAPGSGSLIGTAGIRIDADFDFASYNIIGLRTARLTDQTSITLGSTDLRAVYTKSGDLYYVNAAGAQVQITNGSSIAGATGSISGLVSPASASYSSITGSFSFLKDSSKPGKLAISEISLYEYDNASAAPITIKSPASLGASYSLTLPTAVPTTTSTVFMNSSGALSLTGGNTYATLGTASVPSYTFSGDTNTGIYSPTADNLSIATAGSQIVNFSSTGADFAATRVFAGSTSTAAAPGFAISGDTDTGIYAATTNVLGIAAGGSAAAQFTSSQLRLQPSGSTSVPAYTFSTDLDTGFSNDSANRISVLTAGSVSAIFVSGQTYFSAGTAGFPGLSFMGNLNTGVYSPSTNVVAISANGASVASFDSTGASLTGGLSLTGSVAATGSITSSSTVTGASMSADGGSTSFKVKIFTGTLSASGTATLVTGGSLVSGAMGSYQNGAGTTQLPIDPRLSGSGADVAFFGAANGSVAIQNLVSSTRNYRVTVFYV